MLKRPTPKQLPKEEVEQILQTGQELTAQTGIVKTYDEHFPVFDIPSGNKVLVYVPNHTVISPEGNTTLRCDRFLAHSCRHGKAYETVRCSNGTVSATLGLDGSCPLCNSVEKCWELYNSQYADLCRAKGIDPSTDDGYKAAQPIRDELRSKFAVSKSEMWLTFPIVVIDCEERDGIGTGIPKKDSEGRISGKVFFYSIRESTYTDKWVKALDSLSVDTIVTHPAGTWAILNYQVIENGKAVQNPKPRDAAKALAVSYKQMPAEYNVWAEYFDKLSAEWTPEKAMEVLVANQLRNMDEMNEANDMLMKKTNETLALMEVGANARLTGGVAPAGGVAMSAENALASFGNPTQVAGDLGAEAADVPMAGQGVPAGVPTGVPSGVPTGVPTGVPN